VRKLAAAYLATNMTDKERRQIWNLANLRIPGGQAIAAPTLLSFIEYHDNYINAVISKFPIGTTTKAVEWEITEHQCSDQCNHSVIHKEFTNREISDIEREFRKIIGNSAAIDLLNDGALWEQLAAGIDPDGQGSPMNREQMVQVSAKWAFEGAAEQWEKEAKRRGSTWAANNPVALIPLQPANYAAWLNDMNIAGFELVKNKVTRQFIPEIKRFVTELALKDTPWTTVASELKKVMGTGKRWEWVRIVRTEYMNAADRSSMEQYKQMGVPLVRWNASRAGATCAICLELNGQLFSVDGGTKEYPIAPPLPHPQCRCNKLPVWGKSKYGAGATVDNPRGGSNRPPLPQ
jgi:SPP1 gp7 family putative phage head morphogenesis protein